MRGDSRGTRVDAAGPLGPRGGGRPGGAAPQPAYLAAVARPPGSWSSPRPSAARPCHANPYGVRRGTDARAGREPEVPRGWQSGSWPASSTRRASTRSTARCASPTPTRHRRQDHGALAERAVRTWWRAAAGAAGAVRGLLGGCGEKLRLLLHQGRPGGHRKRTIDGLALKSDARARAGHPRRARRRACTTSPPAPATSSRTAWFGTTASPQHDTTWTGRRPRLRHPGHRQDQHPDCCARAAPAKWRGEQSRWHQRRPYQRPRAATAHARLIEALGHGPTRSRSDQGALILATPALGRPPRHLGQRQRLGRLRRPGLWRSSSRVRQPRTACTCAPS